MDPEVMLPGPCPGPGLKLDRGDVVELGPAELGRDPVVGDPPARHPEVGEVEIDPLGPAGDREFGAVDLLGGGTGQSPAEIIPVLEVEPQGIGGPAVAELDGEAFEAGKIETASVAAHVELDSVAAMGKA